MNRRVCYNCAHVYFYAGSPEYSEYTPGEGMILNCTQSHWTLEYEDHLEDLRIALETARTCPDYQHSQKAQDLGIFDEGGE